MPVFGSLKRAFPRIAVLAALGACMLALSIPLGRTVTPVAAPILFNFGLCMLALAAGDCGLRLLQPGINPQAAAQEAIDGGKVGAGLVYLGRCVLAAAVLYLFASANAHAASPPPAALPYLPILKSEQLAWWPGMPQPSVLGAQVEQETGPCPGRNCWNPRAELKTKREYGFGLGQITVTSRFDVFEELRAAHPQALRSWRWDDRFDAQLQLRALVLKDEGIFDQVSDAATVSDHLAFMLAAYNGGASGVRSDRVMCAATAGCDAARWFDNTERTSLKARQAVQGYGSSFFEINRQYVRRILLERRARYLGLDT